MQSYRMLSLLQVSSDWVLSVSSLVTGAWQPADQQLSDCEHFWWNILVSWWYSPVWYSVLFSLTSRQPDDMNNFSCQIPCILLVSKPFSLASSFLFFFLEKQQQQTRATMTAVLELDTAVAAATCSPAVKLLLRVLNSLHSPLLSWSDSMVSMHTENIAISDNKVLSSLSSPV